MLALPGERCGLEPEEREVWVRGPDWEALWVGKLVAWALAPVRGGSELLPARGIPRPGIARLRFEEAPMLR